MTTPTNVEMLGIVRRSVNSCCRGSGWTLRIGIVSASVLLWANASQAQVVVAPVGVGGYGWGGVGTAESAAEHGAADIIRSEGYYNLTTAQGMVHAEEARSRFLENKKVEYQARNAGREQNSARMTQKRESNKHSAETLRAAAKSDVAVPLSADVLNPDTGKIAWPKALLDNKFSAKRTELEKLFELRARTSGGPNCQTKIEVATSEMAALLKTNISRISSTDYMKAKKFLDSLTVTVSHS
jgi:hypothetical protein